MKPSVVVIGGGVVGTALAYELQLALASTILVEQEIEPKSASACVSRM